MKDILNIGAPLLFMWCSQQLAKVPSSSWTVCLLLTCTLLAAILGNYAVSYFHQKVAHFAARLPISFALLSLLFAVLPATVFLFYRLFVKEMYDFPFALFWTLLAVIVANFLLHRLSFPGDKKRKSYYRKES